MSPTVPPDRAKVADANASAGTGAQVGPEHGPEPLKVATTKTMVPRLYQQELFEAARKENVSLKTSLA